MDRSTKQLIQFAKHYLSLAKRLQCDDDLDMPIKELDNKFESDKKNPVYLRLAHLASAAFRIVNLCEGHGLVRGYNYKKYKEDENKIIASNLDYHIAYLLRDHIGHNEDKKIKKKEEDKFAKLREPIIKNLTPRDIENHLRTNFEMVIKELKRRKKLH